MGGPGSGNRWQSGKATCESQLRVDIRFMQKHGYLKSGNSGRLSWSCGGEPSGNINYRVFRNHLQLTYRYREFGGDWCDVRDEISFTHTKQPLGGERTWFRCPSCHRRCAVLYGGAYFRCRKCSNLAYTSTREDSGSRIFTKARKVRASLGDDGAFEDPFPVKPKGMHWKTYSQKIDKLEQLEDQAGDYLMNLMRSLAW